MLRDNTQKYSVYSDIASILYNRNQTKIGTSLSGVPDKFDLFQNYPNPFNPTTSMKYAIPVAGIVSLKVFDVLGREIATVANGYHDPGYYSVNWNAIDKKGDLVASGVYYLKMEVRDQKGIPLFTKVGKMGLVR